MIVGPIILLFLFFSVSHSHSMLSEPRSFDPSVCRIGGDPNPGKCPGPCDLTAVRNRYDEYASMSDPAAVVQRGEKLRIKYQRNNHGPGGFVRHTLVPIRHMMSKPMHERFAFHYSCWGAKSTLATAQDMKENSWGYSTVGNDGKTAPPSFYETTITIPPCIPDGNYVFGWVWYGGTGGPVYNEPITSKTPKPKTKGFFTDYWSCAYFRVNGGVPLQDKCYPEFINDIPAFSSKGCYSGQDDVGKCVNEPCKTVASYKVPKPFQKGASPPPITPDMYTTKSFSFDTVDSSSPNISQSTEAPTTTTQSAPPATTKSESSQVPTTTPLQSNNTSVIIDEEEVIADGGATIEDENMMVDMGKGKKKVPAKVAVRTCRCLKEIGGCGIIIARKTRGLCSPSREVTKQSKDCMTACCELCRSGNRLGTIICQDRAISQMCTMY